MVDIQKTGQLNWYAVEVAEQLNTTRAYYRASSDPINTVYELWLITLAKGKADSIDTRTAERLGDLVECALGYCRIAEKFSKELGP